jgi:hypothetical protein
MGVVDAQFKTITCNTCQKTVTYQHPQDLQATVEANPWIKTSRFVQTGDQRTFLYCSDLCEVAGIESTLHNVQEAPKVELAQTGAQAQIAAAAAAAKRAEEANRAIKEGKPVTLHTS